MKRRILFALMTLAALGLIFAPLLLFSGCGRQQDTSENEFVGVLTQKQAFGVARATLQELGPGSKVFPSNTIEGASDSMGPMIPKYAYFVTWPDWQNLEVGQYVVRRFGKIPFYEYAIHKVVYSDGKGSYKTAGVANSRTDPGWLTDDSYVGTLALPVAYKP